VGRAADRDEPDEVDPETGAVLLWRDRSENQNHLAAATASARPTRTVDDSGRAVVRFDGADDTVRFTTRLDTIRTVFWVVSTTEATGGGNSVRSLLGDDAAAYAWLGGNGSPGTIWSGSTASEVRNGQTWVNGSMIDPLSEKRPQSSRRLGRDDGEHVRPEVRGGVRFSALDGRPRGAARLRPAAPAR
jgi:hypothetical protein